MGSGAAATSLARVHRRLRRIVKLLEFSRRNLKHGRDQLLGCRGSDQQLQHAFRSDLAIVNYALTLEYLESQFYAKVIKSGLFHGKNLSVIKTFGAEESAHVAALHKVASSLGTPAPRPTGKFPIHSAAQVTKLAATVENLGAAAYLGQAGNIKSKEILAAALAIHSIEARHAATINLLPKKSPTPDGAFALPASSVRGAGGRQAVHRLAPTKLHTRNHKYDKSQLASPELGTVEVHGMSRSSFILRGALTAGAVLGATAVGPYVSNAFAASGDIDILNFALTLEYLETDFYKVKAKSVGLSGQAKTLATLFGDEEAEHVAALTKAITSGGGKPVKKPTFVFPVTDQKSFLKLAYVLENTGVGAYNGAGPSLTNKAYLAAAGSIVQVEARHAASIALLTGSRITPDGAFDKPLSSAAGARQGWTPDQIGRSDECDSAAHDLLRRAALSQFCSAHHGPR